MSQVGSVYGQALYDLAKSENLSDSIFAQLTALEAGFSQEPDFLKLLDAPNLSKQARCAILDESFGGRVEPYVLNFLKILTERGCARSFSDCCTVYRTQYHQDHNILPVTAFTAVPLDPEQTRRLSEKLSALTGKNVQLTNRIDPDVLGGVRLDYDGRRLDDTVAHRLESVRRRLKDTVL